MALVRSSAWGTWLRLTEQEAGERGRLTAWGFIGAAHSPERTRRTRELRCRYERWLADLDEQDAEEAELFRLAPVPDPKRLRAIIEAHDRGDDAHVRALLRDQ